MGSKTVMSPPEVSTRPSLAGWVGVLWGLAGIFALLGWAVFRLSFVALDALTHPISLLQWVLAAAWFVFMVYSEGWRGFHLAWSPRTAARAHYLLHHPTPLRVALAPLFCMCFFDATRRRLLVAYILTAGIIGLIVLVRMLPQPWRGLVDIGVVAGLTVGLLSLLYFTVRVFSGRGEGIQVEMPSRTGADD